METRPFGPKIWEQLPPKVQAYILALEEALRQSLEKIAQLEQGGHELEARLNRNSSNSSQPPSQDPPHTPKKTKREKSGRSPGGQPGHQGNHRERLPADQVDKIVEYRAEACPHCHSFLHDSMGKQLPPVERHQVWELPEIRPHITEHRLLSGWCPVCQVWVKPELPAEVGRSAFGPRLQAWVAILTGHFRQSRRQVSELLRELCGVNVSLGSVQTLCEETSEALAAPYQEVKEAVTQADMAMVDETGWKEKGPSCGDPKAEAMCRNFLKLWPALLTFAFVPEVEPTNNRAERALHAAVLWRKGYFGNQSGNGSRFKE